MNKKWKFCGHLVHAATSFTVSHYFSIVRCGKCSQLKRIHFKYIAPFLIVYCNSSHPWVCMLLSMVQASAILVSKILKYDRSSIVSVEHAMSDTGQEFVDSLAVVAQVEDPVTLGREQPSLIKVELVEMHHVSDDNSPIYSAVASALQVLGSALSCSQPASQLVSWATWVKLLASTAR